MAALNCVKFYSIRSAPNIGPLALTCGKLLFARQYAVSVGEVGDTSNRVRVR